MSTRTLFEFNHDMTHKIQDNPSRFATLLIMYLNGASHEDAEELERFGLKRAWWGHHSTERSVVTKHETIKL